MKEKVSSYLTCIIFIVYALIVIYLLLFITHPVIAQESSKSAKQATESSGLVDSIKDKVEQLKQQAASKAANLLKKVDQQIQNKAFTGKVIDKTDTNLKVETKSGTHPTLINEYTVFQNNSSLKKKTITIKDIAIDDYIVSLGDVDDKGNVTAKKIIKIDKIASPSAQFVFGQITKIEGTSFEIKDKKNQTISVITDPITNIFLGSEDASTSDLKLTRNVVAKGKLSEDGTKLNANYIYITPVYKNMKPEVKKEATSSTKSGTNKQ